MAVKSAALLLLLAVPTFVRASGDLEERLDRARWFEERLGRWQSAVAEGAAESILVELETVPAEFRQDARLHNVHGLALAAAGRLAEAVREFERGILLEPGRAELHLNLATTLLELGTTGRALSEFEQAVELDPASVDARLGLGRGLARLRRLGPAQEALLGALERAPADPRVVRSLAELADATPDEAASRRWWNELERLAPSADSARRRGELDRDRAPIDARRAFEDCAARDPGAVDCAEAAAALALEAGDALAAAALLRPRLADLGEAGLQNLLLAWQRVGDLDAIEQTVRRRPPARGTAWGVVALARRDAGRTAEALAAARQAVDLDDGVADLQNLLGVLLDESGERGAARRAFERALEIDPSHAGARANLEATSRRP